MNSSDCKTEPNHRVLFLLRNFHWSKYHVMRPLECMIAHAFGDLNAAD